MNHVNDDQFNLGVPNWCSMCSKFYNYADELKIHYALEYAGIDYHNVLTRNNDNNDESEEIIAEDNNNNDDIYSDDIYNDNDEQALDLTETGKYNLYGNRDGPVNPNY
ncbi:unnamed protein product [Rhizophagus irregularis]|nr:unnamed protein product [Rhizophagus irregularis]CAB5370836.1 unnamed protein product [Rhizophagus irregularis]